ncbi:MAG TPA: cyclic nucleotide-binding domain-containing protein [Actinomycetota bacterium]|nr:cyclic nucleotide-binding domain-containing protein [Actinomycetota bacterium]
MAVRDIAEKLAQVPLFSDCSKRELNLIASAAKEVTHPAGAIVAREGEPGVGLFLILEGEAEVTIGGRRRRLLGPGDFFGEIALLDGGPRTATVTARTPLRVVGITEWVFRGLIHEHPAIAMKTLKAMASRLRTAAKSPPL